MSPWNRSGQSAHIARSQLRDLPSGLAFSLSQTAKADRGRGEGLEEKDIWSVSLDLFSPAIMLREIYSESAAILKMDWRKRNKDIAFCSTYNAPGTMLDFSSPWLFLITVSREIPQSPLHPLGNWGSARWSYLPKVPDSDPQLKLLPFIINVQKRTNHTGSGPEELGVTVWCPPGYPRGLQRDPPHLPFKMISTAKHQSVLTLIYQSVTLGVATTKLNQIRRENQNSKGCQFNASGSVNLRKRKSINRTAAVLKVKG